jgi:transcription initiation factor TFIID subunit TAF12
MDNRYASAQWERQREREASLHDKVEHIDDFIDTGGARKFFQTNRERILRHFAGTSEHTEGTYDWYASWEQWEQQQQQQQQQQGYAQQQQKQKARRPRQQAARPKKDYVWDFDPNDP